MRSSALPADARARFASCAPPLSVAHLLYAVAFDVTVAPPALLLPSLRYYLCLSSPVLPRPLCNGWWALCCLLLRRSRSLPRSGCRLPSFVCCLRSCCLRGFDIAYTLACGHPSGHCATDLGRFAAYLSTSPGPSPALCVLFRGRRPASCSCCSWGSAVACACARGRSCALCATPCGRLAACTPAALGRSFGWGAVALVSSALLRVRRHYLLFLGLWVLLRLLCAGSWATRCLVLCRSRSLLSSMCRPSSLPRCLVLLWSWGSADAYASARERSSALCATTRACFAPLCRHALGRSAALSAVLR